MNEHVSDEQLSLLIDGELSLTAREAVARHLAACPGCASRHDALVEVAATLRLQPQPRWSAETTTRTLERLPQRRRERDRALPVALAIAASAAAAVATQSALTSGVLATGRSTFGAISKVVPNGLPLGPVAALALLAALVLLSLLAYPLARSR